MCSRASRSRPRNATPTSLNRTLSLTWARSRCRIFRPATSRTPTRSLQADGYDATTIRLINCVLSGACKYAVRREKVDRNVAALVALPTVTKREVIPPEIETVQQLLSLAEAEDHPLLPFLFVLTYTGMRKGELWGLTWRRVDLAAGLIHVVEGVVRSKRKGNVRDRPQDGQGRSEHRPARGGSRFSAPASGIPGCGSWI